MKKKLTQFNLPFLCFSHLQLESELWFVILTLNSVTEKDLRKTCLVKNPLLILVLLNLVVHLYPMIMVMVKSKSGKVPRFNGDPEEFSWWKTNFYSYVMGLDEELWDILEDGVGDLVLDEEGTTIDRKKHTPEQKKLYKKHHKIR